MVDGGDRDAHAGASRERSHHHQTRQRRRPAFLLPRRAGQRGRGTHSPRGPNCPFIVHFLTAAVSFAEVRER